MSEGTSTAERLVELWMNIRYFQKFGGEVLQEAAEVFSAGEMCTLEAEEVLFRPGDPVDGVWVVMSGTLYEWCEDVRFAIRGPGSFVGTVTQASRAPQRITEMQAMSPTRLLRIEPSLLRSVMGEPGPASMMLAAAVTQHVRRQTDAVATAMGGLSWQVFGGRGALLPPAPWSLDSEAYAIPVRPPQELVDELPPGVDYDPAGQTWLVISFQRYLGPRYWPITGKHRRDSGYLPTAETELLMPVRVGGQPSVYGALNFPNTLTALFLGREIFGQPKMFGSTYRQSIEDEVPDLDPSDMRLVLRCSGRTALRVHVQYIDDEPVDPMKVLGLMARLLPDDVKQLDTHHVGLTPEQFARQKVICESRLSEWRRLGQPAHFEFRRPGDPVDEAFWRGFIAESLKQETKALTGHETWGDALELLGGVLRYTLRFLPARMRTVSIAAWRRTFASCAETTSGRHEWDPSDFEVDEISNTYREMQEVRTFRPFRIQDQVLKLTAGRVDYALEVMGDVGFMADISVDNRAEPPDGVHPRLLNYLERADSLPEAARRRLDWGPQVWEEDLDVTPIPLDAPLEPQPAEEVTVPTAEQVKQEHALLEALRKIAGPARRWVAGTELFDVGDVGEHAWLIEDGVVEEWRDSSLLGFRYRGQLVGDVTVLAQGRRRTWQARAVTDLLLRRVEAEALRKLVRHPDSGVGPALFSTTVRHAAMGSQSATRDYERMVYQFFPGNSGRTSPGPYQADDVDLFVIPCARPGDGGIEHDMPPRVQWHPAMPFCWVLVARFTDFLPARVHVPELRAAHYTETGLMVPTLADGSFKLFYPFIHPSTLMAMFLGREVYGFAKSWRNTVIDEVNQRLVMRNRSTTEMELFYESCEWSDIGLRDAMWTWWGLTRAFASQTDPRPIAPPRSHHMPVLAGMGALMQAMSKGFSKLPSRFRTMGVAGWMRAFHSTAMVPEEMQRSGKIPWDPGLFDVDCMGGSEFLVNAIHKMSPVRLIDPTHLTLSNDDGAPPMVLRPLSTHAVRVHMSMTMLPQEATLDYRKMKLTPEDLERLTVRVH